MAIIKLDEAIRNDYNLSPSRYVSGNHKEEVLPLVEAVVLLAEAKEEKSMEELISEHQRTTGNDRSGSSRNNNPSV